MHIDNVIYDKLIKEIELIIICNNDANILYLLLNFKLMIANKLKVTYDKLGIITSFICFIHCIILPVVLSSLPIVGFGFLSNKSFEYLLIFLSFIFGFTSLLLGYKRYHGNGLPIFFFIMGFTTLIMNQIFDEQFVLILIPIATIAIILAHSMNLYLRKKGKH